MVSSGDAAGGDVEHGIRAWISTSSRYSFEPMTPGVVAPRISNCNERVTQ